MPSSDITKCTGKDYPIREKCWRYLAPDTKWQSYANFRYNETEKDCEDFDDGGR